MPPESDNVDYSRVEGWLDSQATRDRSSGGGPPGGGNGDLAYRVGTLEAAVGKLGAKVDGLGKDVAGLRVDIAEIKGRLSQMPTTFQMLTWFVGVALGLVGLVFAVARSLAPH